MKIIFFIFFLLLSLKSIAQNNNSWISFYDETNNLIGYKDLQGKVMIPPKFFMTSPGSFNTIMAVTEINDKTIENYYLLKDGTLLGKDSLYISDMTLDCECEGLIRFRDRKTYLVGMFNKWGKVAIPAEYSDMTRFQNGVAIGLKNATRKCWEGNNIDSGCEHWSWIGGKEILINNNNEVLVDNFPWNKNIDFYSLLVSDKPLNDSTRINFLGVNGKYYSFIDNEKLFETFLKNEILNDLSLDNLIKHSYKDIIYSKKNTGWLSAPKENFLKKNAKITLERLSEIKKESADFFISIDDFIPMPQEMYPSFDYAYDNCKDWNISQYPIYDLVITPNARKNKFPYQDHLNFIKINNEIKFISCTIRGSELR